MGTVAGFDRLLTEKIVGLFINQKGLYPSGVHECRKQISQRSCLGIYKDSYFSEDNPVCQSVFSVEQVQTPKLWSYSPSSCVDVVIPPTVDLLLKNAGVKECSENLRDHYGDFLTLSEKVRHPQNVFEAYLALHAMTQFFSHTCRNFYFFPKFYGGVVTRTVGDAVEIERVGPKEFKFKDKDMMFFLPAAFAAAYIDAAIGCLTDPDRLMKEKPIWGKACRYGLKNADWPLIHGLLGIVAHIGQDLPDAISETLRMILWSRYGETEPLLIFLKQYQQEVDSFNLPVVSFLIGGFIDYVRSPVFEKSSPTLHSFLSEFAEKKVFASFKSDHDSIDSVLRYLMDETLDIVDDPLTQVFRYLNEKTEGLAYEVSYYVIEKLRAKAWNDMLQLYRVKTVEERQRILQRISKEASDLGDKLLQKNIEFEIDEKALEEIIPKITTKAKRGMLSIPTGKDFSIGSTKVRIDYHYKVSSVNRETLRNFDPLKLLSNVTIKVTSGSKEKLIIVRFPKK